VTAPIFVTGGNGFIGSHVVQRLVNEHRPVKCLVRAKSRIERIANTGCELAFGAVEDRNLLIEGMRGCSSIIHLAGLVKPEFFNSPLMMQTHADGTRNVLEAAREVGISRVVYVSSTATVGGSARPFVHDERHIAPSRIQKQLVYTRAKLAAEEQCRAFNSLGMSITIVNPAEVFGPNDTDRITAATLLDFATTNPVLVCDGGISVVHVDDVAAGIIRALDCGRAGERYVLSGENITVRRLAELTLELMNLKKVIITLPRPIILAIAAVGRKCRLPLPFNPEIIPFATSYWFMDNSKARTELRVEFRTARETLQSAVIWLRESGYLKNTEAQRHEGTKATEGNPI
jgi:dihydroflavonol-4-reductase